MTLKEKYKVKRIKYYEANEWIMKKHYAKRMPSIMWCFGLYDDQNILQGICAFGKPASPNLCEGICGAKWSSCVEELNRLVINEGLEENVLSFFVGRVLTFFRGYSIIVSYADTAMGHHGYIYQATNWIYTGMTKERTDIGMEDGSHSRHYDKDIDKKANRKKRSAKHRYVFFAGKKRMTKLMRADLKYPVLPYPKGENQRYDASFVPSATQTILDI